MNHEKELSCLLIKISEMEAKMEDTRYFIETALCLETKKIYQNTLTELTRDLATLYKLRDQLTEK